jgi:enoyl-CoA hydratase
LNRPEKLNALSEGLLQDVESALTLLNPGDSVRVIRVRGAGRAFCPGYDLTPSTPGAETEAPAGHARAVARAGEPSGRPVKGRIAAYGESRLSVDREGLRTMIDRWLRMWNYRKPVIAQVHGYCLSGGLDLIGSCDIVFAAEGTRFGHPMSRVLGIPVLIGMLPLRIGAAATKELLFTGDMFDAEEARRIGLVSHVVPEDELDARTLAFCQRVAQLPLDLLTAHKHVTNRSLELMNARLAAYEGAEFDAICHQATVVGEYSRIAADEGLHAALAWRDRDFELPTA